MSSRPAAAVILTLAVVLAGCTVAVPRPTPGGTVDEPRRDGTVFKVTVREVVDGDTVTVAFPDGTADRRGGYGRLLVYLYDDGVLFNRILIDRGYARLYDTTFERRGTFEAAETAARQNGTGLWNVTS